MITTFSFMFNMSVLNAISRVNSVLNTTQGHRRIRELKHCFNFISMCFQANLLN